MAGISIDFAANVGKFIGGTKDIGKALDDVSGSLDDMARDAEKAGRDAERGLAEIEAKEARDNLRLLAAEAKDAGSDMEQVFSAAADDIDSELKAMATKAEDRLEEIGDAAKDAGKDLDKGLTDGAKDAESAAEKLEATFKDAFDKVGTDAKKAGDDVGENTKRGFSDAGDATATFKDEARANLSESVSSFRGDVEDIPQLLQDVLGGVSADLGVMGGLAAAGVAAAIGVTIGKLQEHADKVNEAKEQMGELAREIADADGNLADIDFGSRMRDWAFEIQDSRSWFEVWQQDAVSNLESVAQAATDSGEDLSTFWQAMASPDAEKGREYLEQIEGKLGDVTGELDNALLAQGSRLDATQAQLDADNANIAALTEQKNGLEALLGPLREEVEAKEQAYEQSVILRAAEEGVTQETIRQRDAIAENNAVIAEGNDLRNESIDIAGNAFLAEGEYTASVQDATTAIAENNAKIAENGEGHVANAALIQDNREQLVGIAGDSRTYAQSMADAGAEQEEVNGILQRGREDFLGAAEAAGIAAEDANHLADELGLIPGSVQVEVKARVEGLTGVEALERTLNRINGRTVTAYVATKQTGQGYLNSGGTVPGQARRRAASGTYVVGEGSDIEDRVPYMLSPGEAVLDAQATRQLGGPGIIDRLNNGQQVGTGNQSAAIDYDRLADAVRAANAGPLDLSDDSLQRLSSLMNQQARFAASQAQRTVRR